MSILNDHVLMLNKSWVPVGTCTVKSAFARLFEDKAKFLTPEDFELHGLESWLEKPPLNDGGAIKTSRVSLRVPEVIILHSSIVPKRRLMQFSRRNLARRDRYVCQYCGTKPSVELLTVDHVMPKRRGGKSTWQNCVLSCVKCNHKKADRIPTEAGMHLIERPEKKYSNPDDRSSWTQPYAPGWSPIFKVPIGKIKPSWSNFISEKTMELISV
jgi:5-methylcytosine-specific restriction endonuclease McrA